MSKVGFIGGGSFGTALAMQLAKKGNEVVIYDRDSEVCEDINKNRKNDKYIKGLSIPENVKATLNIEEAIKDVKYLVLAVPSHVIRSIAKSISGKIDKM